MALTPEASARNADARFLLGVMYREQQQRTGQLIADLGRSEIEGLPRRQALAAAERLAERGLFKRVGLTGFSILPRGIDVMEDPDELARTLPILTSAASVPAPVVASRLAHVLAALAEADAAIGRGEPVSAIDRVHTALHGRVRELCEFHHIELPPEASLSAAFKQLWSNHPKAVGARPESKRILQSLGGVAEALNTLRNHGSLAHPAELPDEADALLAVNTARTLATYLEARFGSD